MLLLLFALSEVLEVRSQALPFLRFWFACSSAFLAFIHSLARACSLAQLNTKKRRNEHVQCPGKRQPQPGLTKWHLRAYETLLAAADGDHGRLKGLSQVGRGTCGAQSPSLCRWTAKCLIT